MSADLLHHVPGLDWLDSSRRPACLAYRRFADGPDGGPLLATAAPGGPTEPPLLTLWQRVRCLTGEDNLPAREQVATPDRPLRYGTGRQASSWVTSHKVPDPINHPVKLRLDHRIARDVGCGIALRVPRLKALPL